MSLAKIDRPFIVLTGGLCLAFAFGIALALLYFLLS